jgi:hypothetical protein
VRIRTCVSGSIIYISSMMLEFSGVEREGRDAMEGSAGAVLGVGSNMKEWARFWEERLDFCSPLLLPSPPDFRSTCLVPHLHPLPVPPSPVPRHPHDASPCLDPNTIHFAKYPLPRHPSTPSHRLISSQFRYNSIPLWPPCLCKFLGFDHHCISPHGSCLPACLSFCIAAPTG